ncbi:MAG TPA: CHASE3 domain-containing protein [Polyangiaceae bacterium]|jgi:CHASE3 domain sensor protein|nr:CHASE3 domain-containing protein [Polyangiaceae bacterium]
MWTFGKKLAAGLAICLLALVVIGVVAYRGVESLTRTSYWVTHTHSVLEQTVRMTAILKDAESGQRGFIITGEEKFLAPISQIDVDLPRTVKELRALTIDNASQQRRIDALEPLIAQRLVELNRILNIRRTGGFEVSQKALVTGTGFRLMSELDRALGDITAEENRLLAQRAEEVESAASMVRSTILWGTILCVVFVFAAGWRLTSSLTGQVGSAVQHIQSSSVELQAAANQQATGTKQQATAMGEIRMTITELLSTSRQIAESAQRVAKIANETVSAARGGDHTVQKTQESVAAIRRQVDLIVNHMLELGRKSQQIGGILEIINELSEQTNILSINATIEAAGAGEIGRRFAVVAEEIRKLSDRVGGSTKEIRSLVDDIRAAVNTTVMATEGGSKAVDAGTRQFSEVAESFSRIVGLVSTTTDAAREIELSTKQQASAVEQVNVAVSNVAQATKETESSSAQTLQTASQLAALSRDLTKLIRPQATA